jgi:hypothetical protein
VPALVLYDQDPYTGFAALPDFAEAHRNFRMQRISPTRGLPQFDLPEQSIEAIRSFLEEQDQARSAPSNVVSFGSRIVGSA